MELNAMENNVSNSSNAYNESKIKSVCVFSGSKSGKNPNHALKTSEFAKELLSKNLTLVYGGGTVGLMGIMSKTIHEGGGKVIGIIPKSLAPREISGHGVGTQIVVSSMHERKLRMYQESDAFVALPGGFGTFEELLEVITWLQLGIHSKPIGLLNVDHYYDPFLKLVENGAVEGFIKKSFADGLISESDPKRLLERLLSEKTPKPEISWLKEDQI